MTWPCQALTRTACHTQPVASVGFIRKEKVLPKTLLVPETSRARVRQRKRPLHSHTVCSPHFTRSLYTLWHQSTSVITVTSTILVIIISALLLKKFLTPGSHLQQIDLLAQINHEIR